MSGSTALLDIQTHTGAHITTCRSQIDLFDVAHDSKHTMGQLDRLKEEATENERQFRREEMPPPVLSFLRLPSGSNLSLLTTHSYKQDALCQMSGSSKACYFE